MTTGDRKSTVNFLKSAARTLYERADDFVGDYSGMTEITVLIKVSCSEIPTVTVKKNINGLNFNKEPLPDEDLTWEFYVDGKTYKGDGNESTVR